VGKRKSGQAKKGFSLLESMVAVTVFGLVITAGGGILASIQQSWRRQEGSSEAMGNLGWAEEFISNEIRGAGNLAVSSGGESVGFELSPGGPSNRFWYWRSNAVIYRGRGVDLAVANSAPHELANLIINNPDGNNIFILNSGLLRIELSAGKNNYNYTLISQVRSRN
jgi:prepilin-type N-terminal cleavage/methylation domain-containing protein